MTSNARRPEAARVAVFAKAPVPGEVKTRLAALLGPDGAASLHAGLVRHALSTAIRSGVGPVELWCAPDAEHDFFASCAAQFGVPLHAQEGPDLGARMRAAFDSALAEGVALILIGSDCPAITPVALAAAASALRSHDVVIAPAEDGGYVLVGLSHPCPALFDDVSWGTAAVMGQTRARLAGTGAAWLELPTLWDVDRPEDYARLRRESLLHEVLS
jgi:rSAM/selenodomain-associated transferase 1